MIPNSDPVRADNLTPEHLDLLQAVEELETADGAPGTRAVGERLHEIWQARGGPYSWHASAPWHGTQPYAEELRDAGLLEVHPGMAKPHRLDQPADTADQYGLSLTAQGRRLLAEAASR